MRSPRRRSMFARRETPPVPPMPPEPAGHREIQREEFSLLFGRMARARLAIAPVLVLLAFGLAWFDPAPWRKGVLGLATIGIAAFFVIEFVRWRRGGLTPGTVPRNLSFAVVVHMIVTAASGGLASPLLYMALPLGMLAGIFVGAPASLALAVFQIAAAAAFAAAQLGGYASTFNPEVFGGGTGLAVPAAYTLAHAAVLSFVFLFVNGVGRAVRGSFERIISRAVAARQESLEAHAQRAEELTAMSAEIAHELKNPLASVKGLAGLLAHSTPEGKAAERLGVLRREVDRMQGILDGFLNFSRPLVPLALGDTDVGALCHEVAALHEGLVRERGLALSLRAGSVLTRCDPRKVKQILINLLQNALEAGGAGSDVELEAEAQPDGGARVRVLDRGRGLDPALEGSLFSPGATTKPRGSGLGLPIARALARQHGGELTVGPRPGGGTVAELVLPAGGAPGLGGGRAA
jgi:two-component system, NtrC family, sensor histidine kinase HydH